MSGTRVIALDLPGHGRSSRLGRVDTRLYADDIVMLLDALAIERAVMTGHSMGGAIVQQIAVHSPGRIAGLVLMGTGSKLPVEPTLPQRIVDDPDGAIDWIMEWAWSEHAPADLKALGRQRLRAASTSVLRDDFLACQAFDIRDRLGDIAVPTLVLGATEDRMVPLKYSLFLQERIPGAELVIVADAGHMFPLEQPLIVANAVSRWLSEQEWSP
jgi:pimeloyl-ACP methyl ester carboxylesterase